MSWRDLFFSGATRRTFLRSGALGAAAAALPLELHAVQARKARSHVPFEPLPPSTADDFVVAGGYDHQVVLRWGDDLGNGTFGYDPDFTAFLPIDLPDRGFDLARGHAGYAPRHASSREGLLVVNHEFVDPRFLPKGASQHAEVGLSVSRVVRRENRWGLVKDARLNRRYDALTEFVLTGPAASLDGGPRVTGTLANCSGSVTPWGTVLSCEENFQDYLAGGLNWDPKIYARRHYGWVVEIDPYDPSATPRKHTAMGRFRHENAGIRVGADGTVAVYMGDDKRDSCVYKFVAGRKLRDPRDRAANLAILESGRLYAADFSTGRWILLDSSAEALADSRETALKAGATPVDRPEDLEVHPLDGSVYIAMTNNALHGNFYGHIVRLAERGGDPSATEFEWSVFATGGPQSGFSCPDNLLFDDAGNLWMCTDVANDSVARGIYSFLGNNSLFFLPRDYEGGAVYRFAVGPVECELTGPCWTPDGSTMFVAAQHPGGHSPELSTKGPNSHWPDGGQALPRGAVVAIMRR
ncbi:MAG TPA: alkaline phosphatase PhoX [Thermoanaerobaculia bacterium]